MGTSFLLNNFIVFSLFPIHCFTFRLKPVFDIPLHIPIQTVVVTPGNTHILAPLRCGKLAVIGVSLPKVNKNKHSVLNV